MREPRRENTEMESVTRWIFIGLAAVLAWIYIPKILGGGKDGVQPIGIGRTETLEYGFSGSPADCRECQKCEVHGKKFTAVFSSRGAALVDEYLTGDPRYTEDGKPIELTTVPASAPERFDLLTDWRALGTHGDNAQVPKDVVDWRLDSHDDTSCTFSYADDRVRMTKSFRAGEAPYELSMRTTIENASDVARVHRLGIENTSWRTHKQTDSHLGRQSPYATEVACSREGKLERKTLSDFGPKDFDKPGYEKGWFIQPQPVDFATTASAYFAQAIVPIDSPGPPSCALQVEERWHSDRYPNKSDDPDYGTMNRSRLVYPLKELAPGDKASYEIAAYYGP